MYDTMLDINSYSLYTPVQHNKRAGTIHSARREAHVRIKYAWSYVKCQAICRFGGCLTNFEKVLVVEVKGN